jgi:uncharacterized protein (DUF983 family)
MRIINTIFSMLFNRCPRCHQGHVFKDNNPYNLGKMFQLNEVCSHCELKYQKEPSFFYGSLYVSYALTSGWFTIWFLLYMKVLQIEAMTFAVSIAVSLIILSPLTIRWSRMIWLNFFYKFNKQYKSNNIITIKQKS